MSKSIWSTVDNSTEVSENVSDAGTFNSTVVLPTTSKFPVGMSVSAEILATVGMVVCSIGFCANAGVLAVLIKARRHFGSAVHTLIANQSAMDLFACVFALVGFIVLLTHGFVYNGNEVLDFAICVILESVAPGALGMTEKGSILLLDTVLLQQLSYFRQRNLCDL